MADWEAKYELERKQAINKIKNSRCYHCGIKCSDINEYTLGESYNNKWFCFIHTEILFDSLNVKNTSELWQKINYHN